MGYYLIKCIYMYLKFVITTLHLINAIRETVKLSLVLVVFHLYLGLPSPFPLPSLLFPRGAHPLNQLGGLGERCKQSPS